MRVLGCFAVIDNNGLGAVVKARVSEARGTKTRNPACLRHSTETLS